MVLGMLVAAGPAFALEDPELPGQSDSLPADIEPPLLLQNLASDDSTLDPRSTSAIENDLTRARQRAASADRLFRAGIIAKVEAEQRVPKSCATRGDAGRGAAGRSAKSRGGNGQTREAKARSPPSRKRRGSRRSGFTAPSSRRPCATWSGRKNSLPLAAAANPTSIARKRSWQSCSAPRSNAGLRCPRSPTACHARAEAVAASLCEAWVCVWPGGWRVAPASPTGRRLQGRV